MYREIRSYANSIWDDNNNNNKALACYLGLNLPRPRSLSNMMNMDAAQKRELEMNERNNSETT